MVTGKVDAAQQIEDLRRENDYLTTVIADLETRMPTQEEIQWLRAQKKEHDNVAWAWAKIKTHAPWIVSVTGAIGMAFFWLAGKTINILDKG